MESQYPSSSNQRPQASPRANKKSPSSEYILTLALQESQSYSAQETPPVASHVPPPTYCTQESFKLDLKPSDEVFPSNHEKGSLFTPLLEDLPLMSVKLLKDNLVARVAPHSRISIPKELTYMPVVSIIWICQVINWELLAIETQSSGPDRSRSDYDYCFTKDMKSGITLRFSVPSP